jgi:hypothetical protein
VSFTLSTAMTLALAAPAAAAVKNFMAVINAGQEVPPTASPAFGNAFFTFDTQTNVLCYAISYSAGDLLGPESAAHINGPGSPGVVSPFVVGITAGSPMLCCTPSLDAADETAL